MKTIYYSILLIAFSALVFSCQKISYEGEYSKNGLYESGNKVYLYFANKQDTLKYYSFSTKWVEHTRQIITIPVKITGLPSKKPLTFKITVNEKESTAKPNVHYTPFSGEFQIQPDSVNGSFGIEMWRENLSSIKNDSIKLVLQLQSSDDLQAAFPESRKVSIAVGNYLEKPFYWDWYEYYWGPYSQIKYLKFLEYYDNNPDKMYEALANGDFLGLSINFLKVYNFFKEHPEYNQILPENPYNPYK